MRTTLTTPSKMYHRISFHPAAFVVPENNKDLHPEHLEFDKLPVVCAIRTLRTEIKPSFPPAPTLAGGGNTYIFSQLEVFPTLLAKMRARSPDEGAKLSKMWSSKYSLLLRAYGYSVLPALLITMPPPPYKGTTHAYVRARGRSTPIQHTIMQSSAAISTYSRPGAFVPEGLSFPLLPTYFRAVLVRRSTTLIALSSLEVHLHEQRIRRSILIRCPFYGQVSFLRKGKSARVRWQAGIRPASHRLVWAYPEALGEGRRRRGTPTNPRISLHLMRRDGIPKTYRGTCCSLDGLIH